MRPRPRWQVAAGAAAVAACLAGPAAAAAPAGPDAVMAATVDAEYERSVALLQRLVEQNSGTRHLAGVEAVGRMLRAELEPLGFDVRWVPMAAAQRAGHLIATRAGTPGRTRMLLIGHLDTVFEPDSPFQTFERRQDADGDHATGPGAGDDKGGMVVIVSALRAMQAAGVLAGANLEIVLTGDEEDAGTPLDVARADLVAAGRRADVALDFEGLFVEGGRDMGSIARRSSSAWTVTATGKSGHSSLIFNQQYGDGAVNELVRILAAFRTQLPEPNLTFNVGLLGGGASAELDADGLRATVTGKTNVIAATAIARGDIRTLSDAQTRRVQAGMQAIVDRHAPGTTAVLAFEPGGYPAMAPTAGNRALLDRLNAVNRVLGLAEMAPLDPLKRGAGDIAFVAQDVDGLVGLGTYSTGDHAPGETVDLRSIRRQAQRAALLMARLAAEPSKKARP